MDIKFLKTVYHGGGNFLQNERRKQHSDPNRIIQLFKFEYQMTICKTDSSNNTQYWLESCFMSKQTVSLTQYISY